MRNIVTQLNTPPKQAVIIYRAGNQGIALLNALTNNDAFRPIAFIDDNPRKQNTIIKGLKIYPPGEFLDLTRQVNISKVLLALGNTCSGQLNLVTS